MRHSIGLSESVSIDEAVNKPPPPQVSQADLTRFWREDQQREPHAGDLVEFELGGRRFEARYVGWDIREV